MFLVYYVPPEPPLGRACNRPYNPWMEEVRVEGARAVERVIARMRRVEDGPLSLEEMAGMAHLSPFHFSRLFKQVTGVPPGTFMAALRLERAKRLLLTTELDVAEVCYEVGYESPGTFATRFSRLVGVSPGQMRRLPEMLEGATGRLRVPALPPAPGGVAFRVGGELPAGALAFAGLFPAAIPQGRPVACTLIGGPGEHHIPPAPDGLYHLMVAALPLHTSPLEMLLPGPELRVGHAPVAVRRGSSASPADIALRPTRPTDPPLLLALAARLLERAR